MSQFLCQRGVTHLPTPSVHTKQLNYLQWYSFTQLLQFRNLLHTMSRLLWLLINRSRYYVWNPVLWAQGKHFHFTKEEKFNTSQSILKVLLPPTRKMSFAGGSDGKHLPAMRETRVWFLGWEDLLEEEMATHSSILAWRIPWTEEPGGLQSMGSQRVRNDCATSLSLQP